VPHPPAEFSRAGRETAEPTLPDASGTPAAKTVRVLSLSTVFPNPSEPNLGLFVRSRLLHTSALLPHRVVAPVAIVDYAARHWGTRGIPKHRTDGRLEVYHPRWFYPPRAGAASAFCLAACLRPFLRRLRVEYPFDIIDAHFGHPEGVAAALLAHRLDVPFTMTLRGNETMHARSSGRRRWLRWALERAAAVITVSDDLHRFAVSMGADPARARTIPNGIDARIFHRRPYRETRARLGIPSDCLAIVSAGYLIERKGHHRVIRALADFRRQGGAAELWVVGGDGREGHFAERIRAEVRERGLENAVHFTGAVEPGVLAEYLSAADLFCLASSREGWPNVVNEALACGAPAVATDVGGVRDMIAQPDYGIVIPPGDQAALTAALGDALRRGWDREAIAAWGGSRSWEQVAAEAVQTLRMAAALRPETL
jgi:teichuronic acid biosynthesis glycosyltransferase TuaC